MARCCATVAAASALLPADCLTPVDATKVADSATSCMTRPWEHMRIGFKCVLHYNRDFSPCLSWNCLFAESIHCFCQQWQLQHAYHTVAATRAPAAKASHISNTQMERAVTRLIIDACRHSAKADHPAGSCMPGFQTQHNNIKGQQRRHKNIQVIEMAPTRLVVDACRYAARGGGLLAHAGLGLRALLLVLVHLLQPLLSLEDLQAHHAQMHLRQQLCGFEFSRGMLACIEPQRAATCQVHFICSRHTTLQNTIPCSPWAAWYTWTLTGRRGPCLVDADSDLTKQQLVLAV